MIKNDKKKFIDGYNEWSKNINDLAKDVPDDDEGFDKWLGEVLKEFEREWNVMSEKEREEFRQADKRAQALARGDYSSLSPELRKIFEKKKKKKSEKEPEVFL